MMEARSLRQSAGFTLIEMIVVIVILAIIGTSVAVFMAGPIRSYFQTTARAELTDAADTALRRIARDIHSAVPNTVRVTQSGSTFYLEFVPSVSGGQYQLKDACFTATGCSSLTAYASTLPGISNANLVGSFLTVYNLYNNAGGDCSANYPSLYCGQNRVAITNQAAAGSFLTLTFNQAGFYPRLNLSSPGAHFQIDQGPVSYVCTKAVTGTDGSGTLSRVQGYAVSALQPTTALGAGHPIANNVSDCSISFVDGVLGRGGLVVLALTLQRSGESVSLLYQVHVNNLP